MTPRRPFIRVIHQSTFSSLTLPILRIINHATPLSTHRLAIGYRQYFSLSLSIGFWQMHTRIDHCSAIIRDFTQTIA
jgi:hypothetical protein